MLENSRLLQKMLRDMLEELDCEVDCVRSGKEGMQKLQDHDYNLMIASLHIFDSSGAAFIEYCHTRTNDCPLILLTSEPNEILMNNAKRAGVTDIFPKSNITYLRSSILYYIEGKDAFKIEGGRVLYIEDSPTAARVMTLCLEKFALDVSHCKSAEDALALYQDNDFDLVVTDIVLTGAIDGLSLVRMIRGQKGYKAEIPILAMSGHDDPKKRVELFQAGINDYVPKPPIEEELAARINNLITNKLLRDKVRGQQKSLYERAMKDQLTGCHNRHCLAEYAPKYISDAARYNFPLSIMILDLDFFKNINDEYGHDVGDTVLTNVGKQLMDSCRQGDFVARIGGEEFIIMLPHCSPDDAMIKAEELRVAIETSRPGGQSITTSIGVASLGKEHETSFDKLFKDADDAVYMSKENGRNCVTMAHPKTARAS